MLRSTRMLIVLTSFSAVLLAFGAVRADKRAVPQNGRDLITVGFAEE